MAAEETQSIKLELFKDMYRRLFNKYPQKELEPTEIINEIHNTYIKDNSIIYYMLSKQELTILNKIRNNESTHVTYNLIISLLAISQSSLMPNIKDTICEALDIYNLNINEIEYDKRQSYLVVGLIRKYGILKQSELLKLLSYYTNEEIDLDSPYIRFNTFYYEKEDLFMLSDMLLENKDEILENHTYGLKKIFTKDELIKLGESLLPDIFYQKDLGLFPLELIYIIKALTQENSSMLLSALTTNEDISSLLEDGLDNITPFLIYQRPDLATKAITKDAIECLSYIIGFIINEKENDNVELEEMSSEFVCRLLMNSKGKLKHHFPKISRVIPSLTLEKILLLKGMCMGVTDEFIFLKHIKNGSVIYYNNEFYVTKAIGTPIPEIIGTSKPCVITTHLFNYNNTLYSIGLVTKSDKVLSKDEIDAIKTKYKTSKVNKLI